MEIRIAPVIFLFIDLYFVSNATSKLVVWERQIDTGERSPSENSRPMKKYILFLPGIFVAMAFIASCQQQGTTVTEEPDSASHAYMNRPEPSPTP